MHVHGACHCGEISLEADLDPSRAVICHCTDCQAFSGAPYRATIPVDAASLQITGAPCIYVKTAQSGRRRAQAFCGVCGSSIYSAEAENPTRYNIRLGLLRERHDITPRAQIWCESALAWAQDVSTLPKAEQDAFVEPR